MSTSVQGSEAASCLIRQQQESKRLPISNDYTICSAWSTAAKSLYGIAAIAVLGGVACAAWWLTKPSSSIQSTATPASTCTFSQFSPPAPISASYEIVPDTVALDLGDTLIDNYTAAKDTSSTLPIRSLYHNMDNISEPLGGRLRFAYDTPRDTDPASRWLDYRVHAAIRHANSTIESLDDVVKVRDLVEYALSFSEYMRVK